MGLQWGGSEALWDSGTGRDRVAVSAESLGRKVEVHGPHLPYPESQLVVLNWGDYAPT